MTARPGQRARELTASLTAIRHWLQGAAVLATFLIGLRHILPGEASKGGAFDAFCPFGGVETLLPFLMRGETLRTTNLLSLAMLVAVVGVSLLAGRAFCGWLCPLGGVQDGLACAARRLSGEQRHIRGKKSPARFPIRLPPAVDRPLRYAKYVILGLTVLASIAAVHPPLHSFCPARAIFGLRMTTLLWAVLLTFLITSILVERFSCKYLCPLGALLAITNKFAPLRLVVDPARCNQCGRCDVECPMDIADAHAQSADAECIRCLECLETCARKDTITLELGYPTQGGSS